MNRTAAAAQSAMRDSQRFDRASPREASDTLVLKAVARAKEGDMSAFDFLYVRFADDVMRIRPQHRARPAHGGGHHPERLRETHDGDPEVRAVRRAVRGLDPSRGPQHGPRPSPRTPPDPVRGSAHERGGVRRDELRPPRVPPRRPSTGCPRISARCWSSATSPASHRARSPSGSARPRARCTDCITAVAGRSRWRSESSKRRRSPPRPSCLVVQRFADAVGDPAAVEVREEVRSACSASRSSVTLWRSASCSSRRR